MDDISVDKINAKMDKEVDTELNLFNRSSSSRYAGQEDFFMDNSQSLVLTHETKHEMFQVFCISKQIEIKTKLEFLS